MVIDTLLLWIFILIGCGTLIDISIEIGNDTYSLIQGAVIILAVFAVYFSFVPQ
jgi:hypothetical protein